MSTKLSNGSESQIRMVVATKIINVLKVGKEEDDSGDEESSFIDKVPS